MADEQINLEKLVQGWAPDYRDRALAEIKARARGERFVFYCERGRTCDGMPHEGVPYNHARSDQWPPAGNDWFTWMVRSGRGSGKTRTGAEWCRSISRRVPRVAMIGRRGKDVRGTMVEGPSGLIYACERAGIGYDWKPSQMEFTFANGSKVFGYSAEEPDSLRGPQHGAGWVDEPAHMDLINEVWLNLLYGMRLPGHPGGARILCTSTPLPLKWLTELEALDTTKVVRVSTRANLANLDPMFVRTVIEPLEGTRNGRQELDGEILTDTPGAQWKSDWISYTEVQTLRWEDFDRIIVAIDPAGTANRRSDETGIIVVGRLGDRYYVLADYSGKYTPAGWADQALAAARNWQADAIVVEKNYGGDMVRTTIESQAEKRHDFVRIIVAQAMRSKQLRAEPVAALYERGLVTHVKGLNDLETEMLSWVPGKGDSPNRVDALVWAITELHGSVSMSATAAFPGQERISRPNGRPTASVSSITTESDAEVGRRLNFTPPGRGGFRRSA